MKRLFAFLFCFSISLFSLGLISPRAHAFDSFAWYWPVPDSYVMSQGYSGSGKSDHRGIDIISTRGVNETVVAARAGTVVAVYDGCTQWCGWGQDHSACNPVAHLINEDIWGIRYYQDYGGTEVCNYGFGKGVVIDHGNGVFTEYAHMSSVSVHVKQEVYAGTELGKMGAYGNAKGLHLHFEIKENAFMSGAYSKGTAVNSNPQGSGYSFTYDGPWKNNPNIWYLHNYDIAYGSDMGSFGCDRTIADGNYLITNAASPSDALYYLDIDGIDVPATAGTNVLLSGPLTGSLITNPPAYEIWNVKYNTSDRYYTITQYGSNGSISLDVAGASVQTGANIQVYTGHSGSCQKWAIFPRDGGGYSIESKVSGWALTAGVLNSRSNITQEYPVAHIKQCWNFIPYSEPTGILDVNGLLDGEQVGGLTDYGTCDVYINNSLVANDVSDYVQSLAAGTTYSISDIKANDGFSYDGLAPGSADLSGTVQAGVTTDVRLKFNSCTLTVNGLLDGTASDSLGNYGTFDLYVDGTQVKNDTNTYSGRLTKGATYEIKDIKANTGFAYKSASGSLTGTIKSGNTTVRLGFDAIGTVSEDWITVDKLPSNINSTICDIEYKHTYQTTAQSSPGSGWTQVPGSGNTTYVNDGNVWETEFAQQTSATCELVGSYYYHYCGTGYGIEHFEDVANGYTTLHVAGLTNGNFEVVATQKDSCHDILQYELKHTAAPWEGQAALCNDGRSDWWYIKYQYQSKKAVTTYDWTKTTDWTSTKDSTASSVQYRYRLKSSLTKLALPANLTKIEDEAFAGTVMNAVIVPDSCTTIGSKAFANCSELLFVSVPKGTTIAADAFEGCGSVTVNER